MLPCGAAGVSDRISHLLPLAAVNIVPSYFPCRRSLLSRTAEALLLTRQAGQKAISLGCSAVNRGSLCRDLAMGRDTEHVCPPALGSLGGRAHCIVILCTQCIVMCMST